MTSIEAIAEKKRIALTSVAAALFLTGGKLVVGLATNSLGILSEAAHSGLDLLAALLTYGAVSISDRPPDRNHQYGHGKIENVSALLQTVLLLITCAWIVWEAISRMITKETHVEATVWSFGVMVVSIIIDVGRSRALRRVARKHNSQALEADALHFSSDVWSSSVVIMGLIFVSVGFPVVDSIAAIGVALLVLFVSYRLGRRTVDALMDRVPEGLYKEILETIQQVEGVDEVRSIRLRPSGPRVFVDTTIGIRRTTPFHQAHTIMDNVERAAQATHPYLDVVVHAEPLESDDEAIVDKVRMIVMSKGLPAPHNLEVHHTNGNYHVDFDIEYHKGKPFSDAHGISSEIEEEIRRSIPSVERVTIHMEEYEPGERDYSDVTHAEKSLRDRIRACVLEERQILGCDDITLLKVGSRYNVSIACRTDSSKSLAEVHEIVTTTEAALYRRFKNLRRVTIHAEPGRI